MKSIKLSKYFELVKPTYITLKIMPYKGINNYNSTNIAKAIANTYRSIFKRVRKEQKKIFFETNFKISYVIDIKKDDAAFYFIVPQVFKTVILEKIGEIWGKTTITEVENIAFLTDKSMQYQISYKNYDPLSLKVDKRTNEPLSSMLNVIDIMKDTDRVTIIYNFIPIAQHQFNDYYNKTMDKIKNKRSVMKKDKSIEYKFKKAIGGLFSMFDMLLVLLGDMLGVENKNDIDNVYKNILGLMESTKELSNETKRKKDQTIIATEIALLSYSDDATRQQNNAAAAAGSFRAIDGDNELKYSVINNKKKIKDLYGSSLGIERNLFSTDEISNFIQLPSRAILQDHKIDHIKIEENNIPDNLKSGYIPLGDVIYKGNKFKAYLEDHKDIGSLPLVILSRQGGGKTTYLVNYCKSVRSRKESIIHVDFIKNCEASKQIEKNIDPENTIVLDFSTEKGLQSLAYNEIKFDKNTSNFDKQRFANRKTELTIDLVNSINVNGDPLSNKMERYLAAATDIVYLDDKATLKDVMQMLQDHKYRAAIINNLDDQFKIDLKDEIDTIKELDDISKNGAVSNKDSKIEGILDRLSLLKRNFYLKKMFNKDPAENINFVDAMDQGKTILVRMQQQNFKGYVKNVITTFIATKAWLAAEIRGSKKEDLLRTHFIIDELSQTKTAEKFIQSILTQTRKFAFKVIVSGQYLDQLDKESIYSFKGAGSSFMLLKGAIKEDFNYFADEIGDQFNYIDLKEMNEFSSLNLIQYSQGFTSFITKLPKKLPCLQ